MSKAVEGCFYAHYKGGLYFINKISSARKRDLKNQSTNGIMSVKDLQCFHPTLGLCG